MRKLIYGFLPTGEYPARERRLHLAPRQPFVSSGFVTPGWGPIAENVARAKPLAARLISHLLDAALDDVAGSIVVQEADHAERALDSTETAHAPRS